MLFVSAVANQVQAGGNAASRLAGSGTQSTSPLTPQSPSYGDTVLPIEEGYYTLPIDARSVIPQYCRSDIAKKTAKTELPPRTVAEIDRGVHQFKIQLENVELFAISHGIFIMEDESYKKNREHLDKFFQDMQKAAGNLAAVTTLSSLRCSSTRINTVFRYADFMAKMYTVINSLTDAKMRLKALQIMLIKLSTSTRPIHIFSPQHTNLILSLDPNKVDNVSTVLIAEGTRVQNGILTPGTLAILLEFSDKTPKSTTPPLSLLFFIR